MASTVQLPSYSGFQKFLESLEVAICASEAHGILCGLICGSGQQNCQQWFAILVDNEISFEDLTEEAQAILHQVTTSTEKQLLDEEFGFELLVQEDDVSLQARTEGLGAWCQGFVSGLGLSGCYINQEADEEAGEALQDLTEVAKVNVNVGDSEEEERAFTEVLEYVRVAAVLIYQSVQIGHSQACAASETVH